MIIYSWRFSINPLILPINSLNEQIKHLLRDAAHWNGNSK